MKWKIEIKTSSALGAGTDGDVYLYWQGSKGRTAEVQLDNPGSNDFERGNLDTFIVDARDVGDVQKVFLRVEGSVAGTNWLPEYVRLTDQEYGRVLRVDLGTWSDDSAGSYAKVPVVEDSGTYAVDKAREAAAERAKSADVERAADQDDLDRQIAEAERAARLAEKQARLDELRKQQAVSALPPAKELSIVGNSVFYALSETESAQDAQTPHKGTSLCGPTAWKKAVGSRMPSDYGLPFPLLAWRNGSIVPADQEVNTLRNYKGRYASQVRQVLTALGL